MKISKIGWCDYSGGPLNIVFRGSTSGDCERGPGCANCYVRSLDNRFHFLPEHTTYYPDKLVKLARMKFPEFSPKRGAPHKPMAFLADTGDLFHENVPDEFIEQAFAAMIYRQDVVWQVLTKREERMGGWMNWPHTPARVTWRLFDIFKREGIDAKAEWPHLYKQHHRRSASTGLMLESY